MKLIVISPEAEDPRETTVLAQLFAAGLTDYHLRKPTWPREQLAAWLRVVPMEFHPCIVLHTHHDLAATFAVGGLHEREAGRAGPLAPPVGGAPAERLHGAPSGRALPFRSRAIHDLPALRDSLDGYDRLLASPVFPSISKPGHAPDDRLDHSELKAVLALPRRAEVVALGGIDSSRIRECRELGFDGVAVLGAIWQATDPVVSFSILQTMCGSELARDSVNYREQAGSRV